MSFAGRLARRPISTKRSISFCIELNFHANALRCRGLSKFFC